MEANRELTSELIDEISAYARRTAPLSGSSIAAIQDTAERYYILATRHSTSKLRLLQQEYDKLKGEYSSLKQMAEFAKGVLEVVKTHKEVHPDIIQSAIQALSSYNSTTNQNESNEES